jgi:hypothetical protein
MPSSFASEALVIWGRTEVLRLHTSINLYLSKEREASLAHDLLQLFVACTSRAYVLQLQDLSGIVGKESTGHTQKLVFKLVCLLLLQACFYSVSNSCRKNMHLLWLQLKLLLSSA